MKTAYGLKTGTRLGMAGRSQQARAHDRRGFGILTEIEAAATDDTRRRLARVIDAMRKEDPDA